MQDQKEKTKATGVVDEDYYIGLVDQFAQLLGPSAPRARIQVRFCRSSEMSRKGSENCSMQETTQD